MKFLYAFLIVLAGFIPIFIGAGFGLDALLKHCASDSNCRSSEACKGHRCVDPCHDSKCGENTRCYVYNHTIECQCLPHFKGNPYSKCEQKCRTDRDCGVYAICHFKQCKCDNTYEGNPWIACHKETATPPDLST